MPTPWYGSYLEVDMRHLRVLLLVAACHQEAPANDDHCKAVVSARAVVDQLLDGVKSQIESLDRAMARYDLWTTHRAPDPDHDTGLFSGAGNRTFAYRNAGNALCMAMDLADRHLMGLAGAAPSSIVCPELSVGGDVDRRKLAADWLAETTRVRDNEAKAIGACSTTRIVKPHSPYTLSTEDPL